MKTPSCKIEPAINRMPGWAAPAWGSLPQIQSTCKNLARIVAVCTALASLNSFGQATVTWTGGNGTGTDLGAATNWGGTLPSTALPGDIGQFDGVVPGNLSLTYNGGLASGFGQSGVSLHLTPNQTGSVNISSPVGASVNLAILNLINESPTASFSLGDTSTRVLNLIWRPGDADTLHSFVNNSAAPNIIYPNVRVQSGGGINHVLSFDGTGDWWITNNLIVANSPSTSIRKDGTGTMYWNGPSINAAKGNGTITSPIVINAGTLVLQNNTVLSPLGNGNTGTQGIENNGTRFKYDAPGLTQILTGPISGSGILEVANGTLSLSGASSYTGNTILSGGSLIVNGAEGDAATGPLGNGGTISFTGGTLQFSANNTFDYSPRFSTAAGQLYSFDTAGQSVLLTNNLVSTGGTLTKLGSGTLTLGGSSSYSGLTTVAAGKLVFAGAKTGAGNIAVANGAALGVTATGTQVAPSTLTVGTSSAATLEFNNVNSTATPVIAAGTLSSGGPITVNVNSGSFTVGQSYPLVSWTSGSPTFNLGIVIGAVGNLQVVGNTLRLNVTALSYVWTGAADANWDIGTVNWLFNGNPSAFANGGGALFDDTASGPTSVIVSSPVAPAGVTVNNATDPYSIASSGANNIGGTGGLTKANTGTLTVSGGANTYSGPSTIIGGILSVGTLANGGVASDIGASASSAANLVLNGGRLQYTGEAVSVNRLFTLGTGNGTIEASGTGALNLNNGGAVSLSGAGPRVLTLTGSNTEDNTLAAAVADSGGPTSLAKNGAGKWVLTGSNTFSGGTMVAAGTLQVGAGGASGSLGTGNTVNNGALIFNRSGVLTNDGTISGSGSVTVNGAGTVILPGDNTYSGGTTITGGTLQVGNGGTSGKLSGTSGVVNDGTFIVNSTGTFTLTGGGVISGTGNVIVRGDGGLFQAIGANTYTGWTLIEPGATFQPSQGNQGELASSVVTNNGTLKLVRQDNGVFIYRGPIVGTGQLVVDANNVNNGDVTLTGTNTYSGGTFIANNILILGDAATSGAGTIAGNVVFTNSPTPNENPRRLVFNHPDDVTFPGLITYSTNLPFGNRGIVEQRGPGTLTLTANNDYPGGTVITAGSIQVGNGGTSGAIGTGPVTDEGILIFNRADNITFGGVISGNGALVKMGAGTLTLTATNIYFGSLTVSNGTLLVNGEEFPSFTTVYGGLGGTGTVSGPVILEAGSTLVPGPSAGAIGTFTINSDLSLGGNVAVDVNRSAAQTSDMVVVAGNLSKLGTGTLTVANVGPSLVVGDKFTLFSQPVSGGQALTVTGAGATWKNDLDVDGSITVLTAGPSVNPNPPQVQFARSGNTLSLAWPTNLGWTLQTNSVALNASSQWFTYPGSSSLTNVNIPINPAITNVFFRMIRP
ncbi:MAG TPA: autotransporter-associated beta strand repeat-containing protein [Verrucomicrobiae bacterium]|nr:autotransporter-associated beta strand repeat-containing protein [Verrucomicrobiae bacterium]